MLLVSLACLLSLYLSLSLSLARAPARARMLREAVETFDAGGAEREDSAGRGAGVGASLCRVHSEGGERTSATILKSHPLSVVVLDTRHILTFSKNLYLERTSWIKNRLDELMLVVVDCACRGRAW